MRKPSASAQLRAYTSATLYYTSFTFSVHNIVTSATHHVSSYTLPPIVHGSPRYFPRAMLSSRSASLTRSPISEIPYDILREIFLHCLSQYPLETRQPDTTVAPMLLCQICSSWRTIALASPSLWSHLSYSITTQCVDSELGSWVFRQEEMDFIIWWKGNQGSMAPFLRLKIVEDDVNQEPSSVEDGLGVLLQYVTSAQYLEIGSLFWDRLKGKVEFGDALIFSNLHTLVKFDPQYTQVLVDLVLSRTPSLLRRLAVNGDGLAKTVVVPKYWSGLTHLLMDNIVIPLNFWFSFIRAVPDLQWAYIILDSIYDCNGKNIEPPTTYALPHLSTLFITYYAGAHEEGDDLAFPLTRIFSALYLPTLHTLSLSSWASSWGDHHAISELYAVLQLTPAVTTLALRGYRFLMLHKDDYPTTLAAIGDIRPIWGYVPHLTHLQLALPDVDIDNNVEETLDTFVRNIFLSNRSWLALEPLACPIQKITLIDEMSLGPNFNKIKNLMMSSIQKYAGGLSNIVFKIISESEDDGGEKEWKEWGSRVC